MRNVFQHWVDDQNISEEAKRIFNESLNCIKAEAYSASTLFLYLAFANVVRDRITKATPPSGFSAGHWNRIQTLVVDDSQWDKAILDYMKMKDPYPIFSINDDIRNQIEYWKNRRNDCAHSKGNIININHVEAFQAFLMSNMNKFVVLGSKDSLINKIKDHFNPSITPPNKSFDYLIYEIDTSMQVSQIKNFLNDVWTTLEVDPDPWEHVSKRHKESFRFFNRCFEIGSNNVKNFCKEIVLEKSDVTFYFISNHPSIISYFQNESGLIRRIWRDKLFTENNDFPLYSAIARNNLIPSDQKNESMLNVILKCQQFVPSIYDDIALEEFGFYTTLKNVFTTDEFDSFDKYNRLHKLVVHYLSKFPIDRDIALAIYNGFNKSYCPWQLQNSLNTFFSQNHHKKSEYLAHIDDDIGIPTSLSSLHSEEEE